jgi:hypothetical protein
MAGSAECLGIIVAAWGLIQETMTRLIMTLLMTISLIMTILLILYMDGITNK